MWIELSNLSIIVLNCLGIPAAHLLISWWVTRMPAECFRPESLCFRSRSWEFNDWYYRKGLFLPLWKQYLPDAAPWFRGASKKNLASRDLNYLRDFAVETCRGEWAHWLQLIVISSFIAWNPFPANVIIIAYSFVTNLPCILNLRYTRVRLLRVISRKSAS